MFLYDTRVTEEFGRGLYATRNIMPNTILTECEILLLSQSDTAVVNTTELQYYTFKYDTDRDCLVLGDGEIFNHSDTPNVMYQLATVNGRIKMVFTAIKAIKPNEQLFINYSADIAVSTDNYINNKSLL